jgi:hypothetical protein
MKDVRSFFNKYYTEQVTFPSNEIDAVVGFFLKRGFDEQAAKSTGIILLNQAKIDGVSPFELVDSLKQLSTQQMSEVVTAILNAYREKTSALGFKVTSNVGSFESRNIKP